MPKLKLEDVQYMAETVERTITLPRNFSDAPGIKDPLVFGYVEQDDGRCRIVLYERKLLPMSFNSKAAAFRYVLETYNPAVEAAERLGSD